MTRLLTLLYAVISYGLFLASFGYFILFVGGVFVPRTIDNGPTTHAAVALLVNLGLLLLFGVQHSVMARRSFKKWWTRIVPAAVERSTYVLITSLIHLLIIWQWRPLPGVVWSVEQPLIGGVLWALFVAGWVVAVSTTFLINHFELFGLQQAWAFVRRRSHRPPSFKTPLFYRVVRHPMQAGIVVGLWSTPHMTAGHLMLSVGMTIYVLIGLYYEERDLVRNFGDAYRHYRHRVPKLLPRPLRERRERVRV